MGRSRRSVRREVASINKGIRDYQRETGQTILWYEFDSELSTRDPVYDEGPSRKWLPGKPVPVVFTYFHEAREEPRPEGFYMVNMVHFTVLLDTLRKSGISNPDRTELHMHDRFLFNGNLYSINSYEKQGHLRDTWITIAVDGLQVKDDEMLTDDAPWAPNIITAPRPDVFIDGGDAFSVFTSELEGGGA